MNESDLNPYAAPLADLAPEPDHFGAVADGVWRDFNLLVVREGCPLPDRCVKCNEPAGGVRKQITVYWHNPWIYILVLQPLIYILVSLIVRHKIKLPAGICRRHRARRRWSMCLACLLALGGLAAMILSVCIVNSRDQEQLGDLTMVFSILMLIGAVVYGMIASRLVSAKRIDAHFAWIKGVPPEYLAELPDLPLPSDPYQTRR